MAQKRSYVSGTHAGERRSNASRTVDRAGRLQLAALPQAVVLALSAGALGTIPGGASAQLDEIIITAERRELGLQDTPISVIAFTGDTLELRGVRDMFELATIAPNLDIKGSRGTGNTSPTWQIRGVSGGGGAAGERGVGFYVDNVYMPRTTGPVMRVLDVDRVEVLRGPQGTLFGRNSTGGAIRVFSRQPGPERDGYVRLTGGNFDHYDLVAMINAPLSDQLFLRAQAGYLHQEGFVQRGPQMLGGSEDKIGRVQLAFQPSDRLRVTFGALHTESESDGSPTDMVGFNMAPACPFDETNPFVCWEGNYADWVSDFLEQSGQERLRDNDPRLLLDEYTMPDWCFLDGPTASWNDMCRQWNNGKYTQFDVSVDFELNERVGMLSTTGYSDFESRGVSDWQLMGMEFRPSHVKSEVFYQELQFNLTVADGVVDFVTGVSYFNENSSSPREALYSAIGSSVFDRFTGGSPNGNLWGCNDTLGIPCAGTERRLRVTGDSSTRQRSTAYGLFASSTVHLGERVNLTFGMRQSWDEKDFQNTAFASDNFIPEDGVSTTVRDKDDWSERDWRATLDVRVMTDFMIYLTSSRAFRSGTFSVPAALPTTVDRPWNLRPPPAPVPPERVENQEVGFRTQWFDNRFRVNATYYDMDFINRQGASAVTDPNAPTGFVIQLVNQGDVELWGTEVEMMLAATDRLTLDAAAGWANYRMSNPCINNGPFLFPPPMDRSFALGGRYAVPLRSGANVTIGLNWSRTGPMQTHPGGFTPEENAIYGCSAFSMTFVDSRHEVPSYSMVNASLRYTSDDGRWTAGIYGNNLTDEVFANNAQAFGRGYWTMGGPLGGQGISAPARNAIAEYRGRPREWGVTFQYNFF
jgi:iron complex outermembrane recepter protein